ncbi:DUF6461 domain-containing protein [Microbispora sp. NPDC049633]|uniref:DUF6461 domain-containing protein n=1 Tax=Microbispora sp. NPDC049633 TaxID=3154355 RepID=UPI003419831B
MSITWIKGTPFEKVVRTLGGDPAWVRPATFAEVSGYAWDLTESEGRAALLAARHDDWTVLLEEFCGYGHEKVVPLSGGGAALGLQWTVNRAASVKYAQSGELVAWFDPADLDTVTPSSGRAWLESIPVGPDQWRGQWQAAALALAEEFSGIRIDREWLGRQHWCVVIGSGPLSWPEREDFQVEEWMTPCLQQDRRLRDLASAPGHERRHEIIELAVEIALTYAQPVSPYEHEAVDYVRRHVRDSASDRIRAELQKLADRFRLELEAIKRAWPDPNDGYYEYLEHTKDPDYVETATRTILLDVLQHALNPDLGEASQQTPTSLGGLSASIEDRQKSQLLYRLGYYMTYGRNA